MYGVPLLRYGYSSLTNTFSPLLSILITPIVLSSSMEIFIPFSFSDLHVYESAWHPLIDHVEKQLSHPPQ